MNVEVEVRIVRIGTITVIEDEAEAEKIEFQEIGME
jgi:hypothetical protein